MKMIIFYKDYYDEYKKNNNIFFYNMVQYTMNIAKKCSLGKSNLTGEHFYCQLLRGLRVEYTKGFNHINYI